jgi:hypothetical protein
MLLQLIGTRMAGLLLQATPPIPGQLTPDQITQIALEALKRPTHTGEDLLALLVPFAFFATVLGIIWLLIRQRQTRIQARMEFQKHLLDKFQSGHEFSEFLESKGGQQFLSELQSQGIRPKERLYSVMQRGIVLAVVGVGMLGLSVARRGFLVPAVLVLALGVGFLLAAAVSNRLSSGQAGQNQEPRPGSASAS